MDKSINESLWKQFGASIDMLENAIVVCPDNLWNNEKMFWYSAYHCLFWLDYYLTVDPTNFSISAPFTLSEFDPAGSLPERVYTKEELLNYLNESREKCCLLLSSFSDELLSQRWVNDYKNFSLFEMMLYNMRHVQHHAAQLNKLLREGMNDSPKWVSQTSHPLKS
jgi:hypothetical protein